MAKSKATNKRKGSAPFRPKARLLVLLGEQLITNEVVAVTELVKNAFDADATSVVVRLKDVANRESGRISVTDDGVGMSLDRILNVWLEPATDFRQRQRQKQERTPLYDRVPLGEKGIGRFAAHKLGDVVQLVTREVGAPDEVTVLVNWRAFYKPTAYLDEVPITWTLRKPEVFLREQAHGTLVEVGDLRRAWTRDMIRTLSLKLASLLSPMPAWQAFDPLPVLACARIRAGEKDEEQDSLDSLIRKRAKVPSMRSRTMPASESSPGTGLGPGSDPAPLPSHPHNVGAEGPG